MKILSDFISSHRERFATEQSNVFAFSFSKITRRWNFLEIIFERYIGASTAFVANSKAAQTFVRPGTHPVTAEHAAVMSKGYGLTTAAHLEIESFYLFAKILLDEVAHAVEHYFGPARGLSLDSHDDFAKNAEKYAAAKSLVLPVGFLEEITSLRKRVSDFRDSQIAHEKSPRTMRATSWGPDGYVRMVNTRIYPKGKDQQADAESLDRLRVALERYTASIIGFIENNADKTALSLVTAGESGSVRN